MCFHNSMSVKARALAARYGRKTDIIEIIEDIIEEQNRVSAFNKPLYPIITNEKEIQAFRWGLIPFWTKTIDDAKKISSMTFNARLETIFEKPSYRISIKSKRCIIPATGYFEFHYNQSKVESGYFIYVKDLPIFSMGGIYDCWKNPETNEYEGTFSQITTPANKLTKFVHNGGKNPYRMPLLLSPEQEQKWIDPDTSEKEIKKIMQPFDADLMDAYPIRKDFYKLNPFDEDILKPISI